MKYEMVIQIPVSLIGPITELMAQDGLLVSLKPVANGNAPTRHHRYINGVRDKGIRAETLLLNILRGGPTRLETIAEAFHKHGFAKTTVSPVLSRARKEHKVVAIAEDTYAIVEKSK